MITYKDMIRFLESKKAIYFLLALAFVFLLAPHIIRSLSFDDVLIGDKPYYHARISNKFLEEGKLERDSLSFNGRPYIFDPYHVTLAAFSSFLGVELASKLLPLVLGLLSLWIFHLILKKMQFETLVRSYSILVLILSPAFVYAFSISNTYGAAILLCLLGIYLFVQKKQSLFILSLVLFFIAIFYDLIIVIISVLLLLAYSLNNRRKYMNRFYILFFLLFLVYLHYYLPIYLDSGLPREPSFLDISLLQGFFSDLGALIGISPFTLILALLGIFLTWKHKSKIYIVYFSILILFSLSYYLNYANIYLTFIMALFSGIALDRFTRMRYKIKLIRRLTVLLIICGLLFSTISYLNRLSDSLPNKEILDSLEWLKENNRKGLVFSHFSKGNWITYKTDFPVFMDSNFVYAPELEQRFEISNKIFSSTTLTETKNILNEQNIRYIFIDRQIKKDIFNDERKGLLFLTRNNETFKNLYSTNDIEIWEVLGQNAIR